MSVLQVIGVLRTPSVLINAVQKGIHSAKYTTRRTVQYNTVCSIRIQCNSTLYSAVHCLGLAAAISPNPILGLIPRMSPLQALHLTLLNASYLMITSKCLKIKISSVMEVAPRNKLFSMFARTYPCFVVEGWCVCKTVCEASTSTAISSQGSRQKTISLKKTTFCQCLLSFQMKIDHHFA